MNEIHRKGLEWKKEIDDHKENVNSHKVEIDKIIEVGKGVQEEIERIKDDNKIININKLAFNDILLQQTKTKCFDFNTEMRVLENDKKETVNLCVNETFSDTAHKQVVDSVYTDLSSTEEKVNTQMKNLDAEIAKENDLQKRQDSLEEEIQRNKNGKPKRQKLRTRHLNLQNIAKQRHIEVSPFMSL